MSARAGTRVAQATFDPRSVFVQDNTLCPCDSLPLSCSLLYSSNSGRGEYFNQKHHGKKSVQLDYSFAHDLRMNTVAPHAKIAQEVDAPTALLIIHLSPKHICAIRAKCW